jgi:hypothetical protein
MDAIVARSHCRPFFALHHPELLPISSWPYCSKQYPHLSASTTLSRSYVACYDARTGTKLEERADIGF